MSVLLDLALIRYVEALLFKDHLHLKHGRLGLILSWGHTKHFKTVSAAFLASTLSI